MSVKGHEQDLVEAIEDVELKFKVMDTFDKLMKYHNKENEAEFMKSSFKDFNK